MRMTMKSLMAGVASVAVLVALAVHAQTVDPARFGSDANGVTNGMQMGIMETNYSGQLQGADTGSYTPNTIYTPDTAGATDNTITASTSPGSGVDAKSANAAAAATRANGCKGDDAAMKAEGIDTESASCKAMIDQAKAACMAGDQAKLTQAAAKVNENCKKVPPQVEIPGAAPLQTVAENTANAFADAAKQGLQTITGGNLGNSLLGGMGNMNIQQMLQQAIAQQIAGQLTGGSSGSSGGSGGGYDYTDTPTVDEDGCDRVVSIETTSTTTVISGTTTTTITATGTCANGVTQTQTQVTETLPDGTTKTTTTTSE